MPARTHQPPKIPLPVKLIGGVMLLGMIAAGASVAVLRDGNESVTTSQLRREIHDIALRRANGHAAPDGGVVGPWWIAARDIDPHTGDLFDLKFDSGGIRIAARRARILLDADADTLSLDLYDLVLTRVVDEHPEQKPGDLPAGLHHMERYTLGPAPYSMDIVRDGDSNW